MGLLRRDRRNLPVWNQGDPALSIGVDRLRLSRRAGSLQLIWSLADTMNGLMALPNLVAVLGSIGMIRKLTVDFFSNHL